MHLTSLSRLIFTGLLVAAVLLGGCDSFVDKAPISNPTKEQFYNSRSDFETAINGAYAALRQGGTFGSPGAVATVSSSYWTMFEMRSDNTDQGQDRTGLAQRLYLINQFTETPLSEIIQQIWSDTYDGIERCNVILDRIEDLEAEQVFKDRIRGEALFIRSLLYYHLAVGFGNVTLKTEPTGGPDEATNATGQVSAQEVYNQIASDLETAQDLLPNRSDYSESQLGKATAGAANTLLGKVYLTLGQRGNAQEALQRVIDSGEYTLVPDYGDLWGPANENNAESIFEVQYTTTGSQGSPFTNTFSPSSDLQTGNGEGENRPTLSMVDAYFDVDGERFQASMDTSYVNSEGDLVAARYITKFESNPASNFNAENNWVVLRYADVLLMMAEALGPSPDAWNLIDQVRNRAGLTDVQRDNSTFYEQLLRERRVEFAFENHRWIDLKRFGAQYDGITAQDAFDEGGISDSEFNLLFPIPQGEVDVAGLEQNPGY